eukprot:jgi/Orpsp1_1/1179017/evm.model.c7180000067602.1
MAETTITLISCDDQVFDINKSIVMQSSYINKELNNVDKSKNISISIPNVTGKILKRVIEYCDYHRNDSYDECDDNYESDLWDSEYLSNLEEKKDVLFDTALAAHYLGIENLANLTLRHIANNIRGKSEKEIREYFNIPYPEDEGNESIGGDLSEIFLSNNTVFNYDEIKNLVVFGDSQSSSSYQWQNKLSYIHKMRLWNFAKSGAVVDLNITYRSPAHGSFDLIKEHRLFQEKMIYHKISNQWNGKNTLFAIHLGSNDIKDLYIKKKNIMKIQIILNM